MQAAAISHLGRNRSVNEDYVLVEQSPPLLVVADGMGGQILGVLASRLAAHCIRRGLIGAASVQSTLVSAIQEANTMMSEACRTEGESLPRWLREELDKGGLAVLEMAQKGKGTLRGMGACLVCAWLRDDGAVIAHVGDCRAYRIDDRNIQQLTTDQTLREEMLRSGHSEEAIAQLTSAAGHIVTQALGPNDLVSPSVTTVGLTPTDVMLLCTDGLHKAVGEEEMCQTVHLATSHHDAANGLVELALEGDFRDNIGLALVSCDQNEPDSIVCENAPVW